jgi:hypothetical protein
MANAQCKLNAQGYLAPNFKVPQLLGPAGGQISGKRQPLGIQCGGLPTS